MPSDSDVRRVAEAIGFRLVEVPCVCGGSPECGGPWKLIDPEDEEGQHNCVDNFTQATPEAAWCFGMPDFQDDDDAVRWLLPWLKNYADDTGLVLHIIADQFSGYEASLWPRDATTATLTSGHNNAPTRLAAALFKLCLAIIQQENPE